MKKTILTLIMIVACISSSVYARPRDHRMNRGHVNHPHMVTRGGHHHGHLGALLLGAVVATVVDNIVNEAVAAEPVIVEPAVVADPVIAEPAIEAEPEITEAEPEVIEVPAEALEIRPAKVVVVREPVVVVERPVYRIYRPLSHRAAYHRRW